MFETITNLLTFGIPTIFLVSVGAWLLSLRRIVPTNVVHIVQQNKQTVSYGVGQDAGNTYYEFPTWVPILGVETRELPVSNFDISLEAYPAYDVDRVPFHVDIKAFFHIKDTNTAAAKVEDIHELKEQLTDIVRGVVRSILAKSNLEEIMGERPKYAKQFTEAVVEDLKSWGVESVKSIELMDVRDEPGSRVIHNIMDKKKSAIERESREAVAKNNQQAEEAELEARKAVAVKDAQTKREAGEANARSNQAIGIADAIAAEKSGIAKQEAIQRIATSEKVTKEEQMKVIKVQEVQQAEIDKEKEVINAELRRRQTEINADAEKYNVEVAAKAKLEARKNEAEGELINGTAKADVIMAIGKSQAEAKKLEQLASVVAQTTLASEIGENLQYQEYLIKQEQVKVSEVVGVAQQEALGKALSAADMKFLINSGDVNSGMTNLTDIFSSKGGSQLNGMVESLKQTEEGQKIMDMLGGASKLLKN